MAVAGAREADVITGHFGPAAGGKAAEPAAPLWALMLATMWLDVVFAPLYVMHVETIDTIGAGGYGKSIIHADYTHSLVGAFILSGLFAAVAAWRWGRRVGLVLGAVAFSHWILDLVVHRADMPLLPGNAGGLQRARSRQQVEKAAKRCVDGATCGLRKSRSGYAASRQTHDGIRPLWPYWEIRRPTVPTVTFRP